MLLSSAVTRCLLASSSLAAVLLMVAVPANAQEAGAPQTPTPPSAAASNGQPDNTDIVVTAQRRSERLQDVPISITAVGNDDLAKRGIVDVTQLSGAVPGLTIGGAAGGNAGNILSIRGVTGLVQAIGAGQAVGVYLDGVYLSRPDAAFFALDDVERLEVLRGPQGTLYGRNTTGGAINIVTREPSDVVRGGVDISYGNYNSLQSRGSLSGPLADNLAASISGSYNRRDSYLVNTVTGKRQAPATSGTVRGKLRFSSPDQSFTATLAADYAAVDSVIIYKNAFDLAGNLVGFGDPSKVSIDAITEPRQSQSSRSAGAALTMNWKASSTLSLTSITSWRKFDIYTAIDNDASAAPAILTVTKIRNRSFNQELRGLLTLPSFRLTFGGNYYHEFSNTALSTDVPTASIVLNLPNDTSKLDAWALFGQAEYDVLPRLTAVVGLRYNNERRSFVVDYTGRGGNRLPGNVRDQIVIPSFSLNFKATSDILLYVKASEGYLAPGFNGFPGVAATTANTFNAETIWAYEAGVKSQFLNRRVTLNVAGFRYDYRNLQVSAVTGPGQSAIFNAANAKLSGVEASLAVRPVRGLTLSAQATYLDAHYAKYCQAIGAGAPQGNDGLCSPGVADRSGNKLNLSPEWSGGLNVDYEQPVGNLGSLRANASYSWASQSYFSAVNEAFASTGGWERVDGQIGLQLRNGPELYVYGKNLTDNRYAAYGARIRPGLIIAQFNDPRTYGVGVRYRF